MKKIYILGGGTFSPVRAHLSLATPAFGETVKKLDELLFLKNVNLDWHKKNVSYQLYDVKLMLTKIISYIDKTFDLKSKTGGYVS